MMIAAITTTGHMRSNVVMTTINEQVTQKRTLELSMMNFSDR